MKIFQVKSNSHWLAKSVLLFALCVGTSNAVLAARISGFVWLDNNANGLQDTNEPGFAQTVPGFGTPNIALYATGSTELIDFVSLDEASNGEYRFENVVDGDYYVCVSNEFLELGLSPTITNAGDDSIDSDFDVSPCSYEIVVSGEQLVKRDLGLAGNPDTVGTGEIVLNIFVDYDDDGLSLGFSPNVPGVIFELYSTQDSGLIQSAVSSTSSIQPLFNDLPAGNYFICALKNVIADGAPVIRPVEATTPNVDSGGTSSEFIDSDFIIQPDGRVCTDAISVTGDDPEFVTLGLSSTIVAPILVNEFCTLENALEAAARATPFGFCSSGQTNNGGLSTTAGTILLQDGSHHDIIDPLFPPISTGLSLTTVKGLGQGAFVDIVRARGSSISDRFADLTIENITVKTANAGSARLFITNSTVLEDLIVDSRGSHISILNSTICGIFIESMTLSHLSDELNNPCANTDSGNQISGFVWMDDNGDGLQNNGEPGFGTTVPGFGAPNIALYTTGSTELIDFVSLSDSSNDLYSFDNIPDGDYYVCVSNEFRLLELSPTITNAGDDTIDSDFDFSPCSYEIVVSGGQVVKRDLGLTGNTSQDPTGSIDIRAFVDYNGDGIGIGYSPRVPGIKFELHSQNGDLIASGAPPFFSSRFEDIPVGDYFICAFREVISDGIPVFQSVEVTTPNVGSEGNDSDFRTFADGSVCTDTVTVTEDQFSFVGLGLSSSVVAPIIVNELCTLEDALSSAGAGLPIGFCPSGFLGRPGSRSNNTVLLQEDSQHDTIVAQPLFASEGTSLTTVKGLGRGAFVSNARSSGFSASDKFSDLIIDNLHVETAEAGGADLTIINSSVENLLARPGGTYNPRVSISNSTVCGIFIESKTFRGSLNTTENPCQ